jgi:putative restriction endonuclease
MSGKKYDTTFGEGKHIYQHVMNRLSYQPAMPEANSVRYAEGMAKHSLGQGSFRILVTDAYHRRCAISGVKMLPVLQAAHIKPYAMDGSHDVTNGILLRSDLHTLFDDGYLTITKDLILEVSHRLREDYGNGKDYYKFHGSKLLITPDNKLQAPSPELLEWHNVHRYLG